MHIHDYPIIREKFYNFINTLNIKIDVMVVEKLKCFEATKKKPWKTIWSYGRTTA